jgi:hypothetical protein
MGRLKMWKSLTVITATILLLSGCSGQPTVNEETPLKSRLESIPLTAIKQSPSSDRLPPQLHSSEFQLPVPMDNAVNTAGAEDSAFITPDGNSIYFFFTPNCTIPAEKQLTDGVTGIYFSRKVEGQWQPAERVLLQKANDVALDGCVLVQGNQMWFCSARKGNYRGVDMWTAEYKSGKWTNWQNAGTADGNEIYFHSGRAGGKGGYDIWVTRKVNNEWQEPENIEAINTADTEGWPFVTQDGKELWFTRWYLGSPALFRSKKVNSQWSTPELIISQFAAEPSLDNDGNLYFTHHFYWDGIQLDADIYVAYRK